MTMHYDICVIGAGPAGTSIANRLAEFGYKILILEKNSFPRQHIGLSLTTGIHHWLKELEIDKKVEALKCIRATKSYLLWSSKDTITKTFSEDKAGFHIDRGRFDDLLLTECKRKNIDVIQPAVISNLVYNSVEKKWSFSVQNHNQKYDILATFLIEASGRNSIIQNKKKRYLPKLLATYSYWDIISTNAKYSFIEAGKDNWFWGAPIGKNKFVLCIFSDPGLIKQSLNISSYYNMTLSDSKFATQIINSGNRSDIKICDASSYYSESLIDEHFIRIGDAAYTTDPISSQGVQKAIKSGIQGAIVVNTILKKHSTLLAIRYFNNLVQTGVKQNKRWTIEYYNDQKIYLNSKFWQIRSDGIEDKIKPQDHEISLNKHDSLVVNKKGKYVMVPVLGNNEVIEKEGFLLEGNDSPFVFINNLYIVPLLKEMDGKTLVECIVLIRNISTKYDAIKIIKWLVYENVILALKK